MFMSGYLGIEVDLTVWNRTKSKCEPLISLGAKYQPSPEEVAASCDLTFTMLVDPQKCGVLMLLVVSMELQMEWAQENDTSIYQLLMWTLLN
ncbi:putative 3-hydroxyisobutyrate dehydrogenase 1, mitochondrial [Trifolium repens]|nr:putative 3-hydroxyisobutyrate dehydrogenase 1, mitochondrial [Trifolium repens]